VVKFFSYTKSILSEDTNIALHRDKLICTATVSTLGTNELYSWDKLFLGT
jgi:hypothetical protein